MLPGIMMVFQDVKRVVKEFIYYDMHEHEVFTIQNVLITMILYFRHGIQGLACELFYYDVIMNTLATC